MVKNLAAHGSRFLNLYFCFVFTRASLEMKRAKSAQVLQVKSLLAPFGVPSKLLSEAMTPPAASRVTAAVRMLYEAGALAGNDEASAVTALGRLTTHLPIDLKLVKFLLFARVFGSARALTCLSP